VIAFTTSIYPPAAVEAAVNAFGDGCRIVERTPDATIVAIDGDETAQAELANFALECAATMRP
jgi:hypothetical protein